MNLIRLTRLAPSYLYPSPQYLLFQEANRPQPHTEAGIGGSLLK